MLCQCKAQPTPAPDLLIPAPSALHGQTAQLSKWLRDFEFCSRAVPVGPPVSVIPPGVLARTGTLAPGEQGASQFGGSTSAGAWLLLRAGAPGLLSLVSTLRR